VLVRHNLQLLEVVLREFQICGSGPVKIDPAEVVNDADRVFVDVLTGRVGEDLADPVAPGEWALA
jgi:hypothetical protein